MDEETEAALMRAGAQINALQANERRLIDKLAAMSKDAERYQFLRDTDTSTWLSFRRQWRMDAAMCDAAVDNERAKHLQFGAA